MAKRRGTNRREMASGRQTRHRDAEDNQLLNSTQPSAGGNGCAKGMGLYGIRQHPLPYPTFWASKEKKRRKTCKNQTFLIILPPDYNNVAARDTIVSMLPEQYIQIII